METLPSGAPMPIATPAVETPAVAPVVETPVVETPVVETSVVETPPPTIEAPAFNWKEETGYESRDDINSAIEAGRRAQEQLSNPILQSLLSSISDPEKITELAPLVQSLTIDYDKMSPIQVARAGWDKEYGAYAPEGPLKEEAFEEYLRTEFSISDPDDVANSYGASAGGITKFNAKVAGYRTEFKTDQQNTRSSLSQVLQPKVEQPSPQMTQSEYDAQMREYQSDLAAFKPDVAGIAPEIASMIDTAPSAEWLQTTAQELSQAPNLMLDRYLTFDNGVAKYNMKQILQDRWKIDHYDKHMADVAAKSGQTGKAAGAMKIVEKLQHTDETPSLVASSQAPAGTLPSGARRPIGLTPVNR